MVHHLHLSHGAEFKINLETDHIILHGSVEESSGIMLRGSVILDCHEVTKVRAITLKLEGKVKVNWLEGIGVYQQTYKEDQTIIEHEWSFLPYTGKTYHLSEHHYRWDFELPLPGDLPETLQHEFCQVYYRLKAVADRPTFAMNYTDTRSIKVSRLMLPTCLELLQSISISNVWVDKFVYDINMPSKCYTMGQVLPVTFDFTPVASTLKILAITIVLKEYLTLSSHGFTKARISKTQRNEHFQISAQHVGQTYHKTETMEIPDEDSRLLMMDTINDFFQVKHKLKIIVSLKNADGHVSELRLAIPIVIATISPEEDANALPTYENAWRTAPYDPATVSQMISSGALPPSLAVSIPNAAASMAHESLLDGGDDEHEYGTSNIARQKYTFSSPVTEGSEHTATPSPWQGVDLSRVPSYTTAVRSGRLYSISSTLPTYESISIPGRIAR
ncbi:hypothetical protein BCR42DRAFT_381754 [Absidia repens]|uniref:Arrestin C-terminal-like domain-containing protein n=1 Tax=Absidia repens TaxID=90262 RepID=A0A1X2I5E1_9FUNG|nr:hypothetical protein BCR42DRAFT_381754 [Absidia repens]